MRDSILSDNIIYHYIITGDNEAMVTNIEILPEYSSETLVVPDKDSSTGIEITGFMVLFPPCDMIKTMKFADGIQTIPKHFFSNLLNLNTVIWPSSCTVIPDFCFYRCSNLKILKNIDNVLEIGTKAFYLTFIKELDLSATQVWKVAEQAFSFSNIRKVVWTNRCTEIPAECFRGSALKEIYNINHVTVIKEKAFASCKNITKIDLSDTRITDVDKSAFYNCFNLKTVVWPDSCPVIPRNCFYGSALSEISMPGVEYIAANAFTGCDFKSIDLSRIPVDAIGAGAFSCCKQLKKVIWNTDCATIPYGCFENCLSLTTVANVHSVRKISSYAFYNSGLRSINLKRDYPAVEEIGVYVFSCCRYLVEAVWTAKSVAIGDHTFDGCSSLIYVTDLENVSDIGLNAFDNTMVELLDLSQSLISVVDTNCFKGHPDITILLPYYASTIN